MSGRCSPRNCKCACATTCRILATFRFTSQPADGFTIRQNGAGPEPARTDRQPHLHRDPAHLLADHREDRHVEPRPVHRQRRRCVVPSANDQGGDPFFRQFFNQGEQKPVTLATETVTAQSLPLPSENVPANFNGAVGDFTNDRHRRADESHRRRSRHRARADFRARRSRLRSRCPTRRHCTISRFSAHLKNRNQRPVWAGRHQDV